MFIIRTHALYSEAHFPFAITKHICVSSTSYHDVIGNKFSGVGPGAVLISKDCKSCAGFEKRTCSGWEWVVLNEVCPACV